jgi:hypothetical protein
MAYRAAFRKADAEALVSLREAFQSDSQWALPFRDVARLYARGATTPMRSTSINKLSTGAQVGITSLRTGKLAVEYKRPAEAELAFRRAIEADQPLRLGRS